MQRRIVNESGHLIRCPAIIDVQIELFSKRESISGKRPDNFVGDTLSVRALHKSEPHLVDVCKHALNSPTAELSCVIG